ncbi:Rv3235 family protein [Nocardia sp. NPDC051832]|uniref:Rv3235 family protein n=1 Tax=Nocardia sp. NPDC051832 TaxID=3155673 RepID=UPI003443AE89
MGMSSRGVGARFRGRARGWGDGVSEARRYVRPAPNYEPPLRSCGCGPRRRVEVEPAWVDPPVVREAPCSVDRRALSPRMRRLAAREPSPVVGEARSTARKFADRVLRAALEVLDHRRPVAQLRGMVSTQVLEALRTVLACDSAPSRELGAAVLGNVDVVMVDAENAEICARYVRGQRTLAIAARARWVRGIGWQLAAFRLLGV